MPAEPLFNQIQRDLMVMAGARTLVSLRMRHIGAKRQDVLAAVLDQSCRLINHLMQRYFDAPVLTRPALVQDSAAGPRAITHGLCTIAAWVPFDQPVHLRQPRLVVLLQAPLQLSQVNARVQPDQDWRLLRPLRQAQRRGHQAFKFEAGHARRLLIAGAQCQLQAKAVTAQVTARHIAGANSGASRRDCTNVLEIPAQLFEEMPYRRKASYWGQIVGQLVDGDFAHSWAFSPNPAALFLPPSSVHGGTCASVDDERSRIKVIIN